MKQAKGPVLVTGGCGFIGSALVHALFQEKREVHVLDAMTYAANINHLPLHFPLSHLHKGRLEDASWVKSLIETLQPQAIVHAAAETHVDRSIRDPEVFLQSNIVGTQALLQAALAYWKALDPSQKQSFRLLHVSTDEVYGSQEGEGFFDETSPYAPNSPYAASKAASDHLVRAWNQTFGLPTITTHCTNNFGPRQHTEKFIPTILRQALSGEPIPIYGDGLHRRDWLFVEDHVRALVHLLENAPAGETYALSSNANERSNLDLAHEICHKLDVYFPTKAPHTKLITHVTDRLGHDRRYALHHGKYKASFGPISRDSFSNQLQTTLDWYIHHKTFLFGMPQPHQETYI